MTDADQFGDGLYRFETDECPVDGCDGEISKMPRSDELLCSEDASHLFNRGALN